MPRCFPPDPVFPPERAAEGHLFHLLADQLPDDAALFWSESFTDERGECEADLIVAWPDIGIAVIEVKGGHVSLVQGRWRQSGRDLDESPVAQAQRAKHALFRYLEQRGDWPYARPFAVHLAAFPFTPLPATFSTPEAPRHLLLDRDDCEQAAARVKQALDRTETRGRRPDADEVERLVDVLEVTLPGQDAMLAALAEDEAACELLTRQQASRLDMLRRHRRLEVRGGAGTGKTFLALEQARRLAAGGQRVAVTCYSRGLAQFLQRSFARRPRRERPAYVGTFHGLGLLWGAPEGSNDDTDYWERRLPQALHALARDRPAAERFDAIVVDEAQDFDASWWPPLLATLKEPETGGLYVFLDEAQRVFARQGQPPVDLLTVDLDENLRNTQQIAQTFGSLAAAQMRYRGPRGLPVRLLACPTEQALDVADDAVEALLEEGWPPGALAVLTTYRRHPEQVNQVEVLGHEGYWADFWAEENVFYANALNFKGLERPVVVLAVNGFRDEARAKEILYVGLSRARSLLTVVGDPDLIARVGGEGVARRLASAERFVPAP